MGITYPYPVTVLADRLHIASVTWDIQRNDELSGVGDGRVWQAELADPLWTADVRLSDEDSAPSEQIAALIRKLHGAQESFYLYNPARLYPQADPTGSILGPSAVQVHTGGTNTLRLKGLPAGYVLTVGDKFHIAFASTQHFFGEFSETVTASEGGITPAVEVFPHIPPGIAVNDSVTLARPACRGFIVPGSHNPGVARLDRFTTGSGFKFMERRR